MPPPLVWGLKLANAFIRKLEGYAPLSQADRDWLVAASSNTQKVDADIDLIREGDAPENVYLIMEGLACRYKLSPEGRRQIFAYLVPGDFCDLHIALLDTMDHSIATLAPCSVVKIPKETILKLTEERPALTRAFWWCSLVDEAVLREWVVNVGSRQAEQRIAHLFCELHVRLKAIGRTIDGSFVLPITQTKLADTVGLSDVHVNRSLKQLREQGLVTFRDDLVKVPDMEKLKAFAGFNPNYLHLTSRSQSS